MTFDYFVLMGCFVAVSLATDVSQCPGGNIVNLQNNVQIGDCTKPPCKLKKNTQVPISFKFIADQEYQNLRQKVTGNIAGLNLPFIGVDGTNPCGKIYESDGVTKNECHFVKGQMYVFKDQIDVLQIYPKVKTVVHWSMTDKTGKHAICFNVPARIVN